MINRRGDRLYLHKKTGGRYKVIAEGILEKDLTPVIIYSHLEHGQVWVRPKAEFEDGRFVEIPAGAK